MMLKSGRPFWDVADISSHGYCSFDFSGPSTTSFLMTFFWPYVIIMFLFKYYRSTNHALSWILLGLLLMTWVANYFYSFVNGQDYLYQIIIGQFVGLCYLIACLVFDKELHRYSLKTGFSMRSSRARKFYLFFVLLGLFVLAIMLYYAIYTTWTMP